MWLPHLCLHQMTWLLKLREAQDQWKATLHHTVFRVAGIQYFGKQYIYTPGAGRKRNEAGERLRLDLLKFPSIYWITEVPRFAFIPSYMRNLDFKWHFGRSQSAIILESSCAPISSSHIVMKPSLYIMYLCSVVKLTKVFLPRLFYFRNKEIILKVYYRTFIIRNASLQ